MKECNWCKSQVNKDAKVCPNCGKAIWEQKDKKRLKKLGMILAILFSLLLIIIIIIVSGDKNVEEKCKNAEYITLEEVYDLHSKNVPKARELYEDKYFKFKGKVTKILDNYTKIESKYITADVYFGNKYKDRIQNMKQNEEVTYCGKVKYSLSVQIKNAIILDEGN